MFLDEDKMGGMQVDLERLIITARQMGASDIHLAKGMKPKFRVDGKLRSNDNDEVLTKEMCQAYADDLISRANYDGAVSSKELDFAISAAGERIRVNLFLQQGCVSAALRILSSSIPKLEMLGLPPVVEGFPQLQQGIVLVTGETGSGKSTTLAAILDRINHTRDEHIITLEDPIEYIYEPDRCLINQRQIGTDTDSFSQGLRASLREDPDIILIGEMRDKDTIETALTAAETGHLVFGTLHTNSAPDTVDRIIGVFPPEQQSQIRLELSLCLRAVLAQQLLPRAEGKGRAAACEVMIVTSAIQNLIREGKTPQMYSSMLSGASVGSVTLDNTLIRMVKEGIIDRTTALGSARDKEHVEKSIGAAKPAFRW